MCESESVSSKEQEFEKTIRRYLKEQDEEMMWMIWMIWNYLEVHDIRVDYRNSMDFDYYDMEYISVRLFNEMERKYLKEHGKKSLDKNEGEIMVATLDKYVIAKTNIRRYLEKDPSVSSEELEELGKYIHDHFLTFHSLREQGEIVSLKGQEIISLKGQEFEKTIHRYLEEQEEEMIWKYLKNQGKVSSLERYLQMISEMTHRYLKEHGKKSLEEEEREIIIVTAKRYLEEQRDIRKHLEDLEYFLEDYNKKQNKRVSLEELLDKDRDLYLNAHWYSNKRCDNHIKFVPLILKYKYLEYLEDYNKRYSKKVTFRELGKKRRRLFNKRICKYLSKQGREKFEDAIFCMLEKKQISESLGSIRQEREFLERRGKEAESSKYLRKEKRKRFICEYLRHQENISIEKMKEETIRGFLEEQRRESLEEEERYIMETAIREWLTISVSRDDESDLMNDAIWNYLSYQNNRVTLKGAIKSIFAFAFSGYGKTENDFYFIIQRTPILVINIILCYLIFCITKEHSFSKIELVLVTLFIGLLVAVTCVINNLIEWFNFRFDYYRYPNLNLKGLVVDSGRLLVSGPMFMVMLASTLLCTILLIALLMGHPQWLLTMIEDLLTIIERHLQ